MPLFSTWWGVSDSWARTPDSGAFATRRKQKGHEEDKFQADIFGPPEATLSVEAKYRESLDFDGLLYGTGLGAFADWWGQAKDQAGIGKVPLLVFRKNRRPWWVAMSCGDYGSLIDEGLFDWAKAFAYVTVDGARLVLFPLDVFFCIASPERFGKVPQGDTNG